MPRRLAAFVFAALLYSGFAALLCCGFTAVAGEPPERLVPPAERVGLDVTLYQDDSALVRDRRSVGLDKGPALLVWDGVAHEARAASALLSGANLTVKAQGFDLDGATGDRLLAESVGREVGLVWREGEREERGRVLAAGMPPLFDVDGKVVAGQPARIVYDGLPAGFKVRPSFHAVVTAETAGRRDIELTYLTGGLGWQADYVAELAPGGDHLTLSAWTTLTNASGIDFPVARVALVAGRPNRAGAAKAAVMAAPAMATPEHEPLGPYHLFTLPEPVTLRQGERTQAVLLAPTIIKVERELMLDPLPAYAWRGRVGETAVQNPVAILRLDNSAAAGLGRPLPAGALRVYQRGHDGGLAFLGEDRLAATPERGGARIAIGQVFDVTARRVQVDFQHVSAEVAEAAYEVRLANAGDKPALLTVREAFGADWLVIEESAPHRRLDAFTAAWTTTIPAKGETVLKYRVRVKG